MYNRCISINTYQLALSPARLRVRRMLRSTKPNSFQTNLAYESPFVDHPQLAHDVAALRDRSLERRQTIDASGFKDDHYATFYGGDFSNSPFIWGGGVNFTHSVASGDPFADSVLLWTRAVPISSSGSLPDQDIPICLSYKISTSKTLSENVIDSGEAFTSYDVDWTIKVEATGLHADTKYIYQFSDCATKALSPIGSTRTIASPDTPARFVNGGRALVLAIFSCSQYQAGWFNAYGYATYNTSADIFVHLGDYIYESLGNGARIGRQTLGRELATIRDYRQRLNQYRTDPSLVAAHQAAPWVTVWMIMRLRITLGRQELLILTILPPDALSPLQAPVSQTVNWRPCARTTNGCPFAKWMPRTNSESGEISRSASSSIRRCWTRDNMTEISPMFTTTQAGRSLTDGYVSEYINTIAAFENRSLMGAAQEKWLYNTLSQSKARGAVWRVIGQQIVFTQLNESGEFDLDAWDGYRANRARVLNHLYDNEISNTIILAGDSHANWVSDLAHPNDTTTYNPLTGAGAIGVEFAGTAVTSGSAFGSGIAPAAANQISRVLVGANADLQWSEGSYRGFFTLTIDLQHINATYYAMRNNTFTNLDGFASAHFVVKAGENRLSRPVGGGSVNAGVLKSQTTAGMK
ncbi:unnamed protein product [Cyclocybe aegerita]|uniref:Alkaline phosphatase D n=1 Tax=Cyclocybe aegerita TaxID=1973307 RepID=A0A8S0X9U2_CYCAE|nr:unnamed protein product [Cyclocybe aegerita]